MTAEIRIETARVEHRPLLERVALEANDAPYDLLTVLDEKCFDPGVSGPSLVLLAHCNQEPAGFAVLCGRFVRLLLVHREHRGKGVGSELLAAAERHGERDGQSRIVIATEAGNYFVPGVLESDGRSRAFFEKRGYLPGETTSNMDCDLVGNPLIPKTGDGSVRRVAPEERHLLTRFIEEHFGRIWAFEVQPALRTDSPTAFVAEAEGKIVGFSAHDANNRRLGFFGPTGVEMSRRGKGIGRSLLLASLRDLRSLGHARAVIPWTDAIDFYTRACGAVVSQRFVAYEKSR